MYRGTVQGTLAVVTKERKEEATQWKNEKPVTHKNPMQPVSVRVHRGAVACARAGVLRDVRSAVINCCN